jgi:very-short-patch-repair endonuclease
MRAARDLKPKRSRRLGQFSTKAELKLWSQLRSRALDGRKFIRRHPIGPFIVGFVCRERRLVIEVDGGGQAPNERDQARDRWLADRGYSVLRFSTHKVLGNIEDVLEAVRFTLADTLPPPASRPLPARSER